MTNNETISRLTDRLRRLRSKHASGTSSVAAKEAAADRLDRLLARLRQSESNIEKRMAQLQGQQQELARLQTGVPPADLEHDRQWTEAAARGDIHPGSTTKKQLDEKDTRMGQTRRRQMSEIETTLKLVEREFVAAEQMAPFLLRQIRWCVDVMNGNAEEKATALTGVEMDDHGDLVELTGWVESKPPLPDLPPQPEARTYNTHGEEIQQ